MKLPPPRKEAGPQGNKIYLSIDSGRKMASRLRLLGNQLKSFWEEQPVIVISIVLGLAGMLLFNGSLHLIQQL